MLILQGFITGVTIILWIKSIRTAPVLVPNAQFDVTETLRSLAWSHISLIIGMLVYYLAFPVHLWYGLPILLVFYGNLGILVRKKPIHWSQLYWLRTMQIFYLVLIGAVSILIFWKLS